MILIVHYNPYLGPCCNPDNPCDLSALRVPNSRSWPIVPGTLRVNDYVITAESLTGGTVSASLAERDGMINGFEVRE